MNDPHQVGDRVKRLTNVHDLNSPMMHGVIIHKTTERERYDLPPHWRDNMLYDVKWDGVGQVGQSYFWWGIDPDVPIKPRNTETEVDYMSIKISTKRRDATNEQGFVVVMSQDGREIFIQPEWLAAVQQAMVHTAMTAKAMSVDNIPVTQEGKWANET